MTSDAVRSMVLAFAALALTACICGAPGHAHASHTVRSARLVPARRLAALDSTNTLPALPSNTDALGGYDVLIADRGNNRILLVSPAKKILWEYDFVDYPWNAGADDAFFTDGGKRIVVSLEHDQVIQVIDIRSKKVIWEYGHRERRGGGRGFLDFPDDAYQLPNGNVIVADIRNCRILEIAPDKQIVRQAGVTSRCGRRLPLLAAPNGDTPLANGHVLISTIDDHSLIELDKNWHRTLQLNLPLRYPSDPQMTKAGNFLLCDYTRPGKIIEIDRNGRVLWTFTAKGQGNLNRPSLAMELPNGNILANDDLNHRVIVIDKASSRIVWQYGVTGRHGSKPGYLHIPDGLDIIKAN